MGNQKIKPPACNTTECDLTCNRCEEGLIAKDIADIETRIMRVHTFVKLAERLLVNSKWGKEYGLKTDHDSECKIVDPDDYCAIRALLEGTQDQVNEILGLVT